MKPFAFIVPNALLTASSAYVNGQFEKSFYKDGLPGARLYVQIWIVSDECQDWDSYGGPLRATYFPLDVFLGKEEGDTVTLTTDDGGTVDVVLRQNDGRYYALGDFPAVLHQLLDSARRTVGKPNYICLDTHFRDMDEHEKRSVWAELLAKYSPREV